MCLSFAAMLTFITITAIETSKRHTIVQYSLAHLPDFIELYQSRYSQVPKTLNDVLGAELSNGQNAILRQMLNDKWGDRYEYSYCSNIHKIVVFMPRGIFVQEEHRNFMFTNRYVVNPMRQP